MEPEAQLIAAQAAEELARQQATGTVDELQRGRMAQQILQGAGQQAQAREAQQRQAEFARRKRLGDVVAAGEAEKRLREYRKKTQDIGGMFQAGLGAASALAGQGASYLAEQSALAEGLKAAEAKGGVQGAIDFLNENPNYDPGQETLQRLYAGSQMGQQDASIDAVERELLQEQTLADIELRKRNQRAVEALNKQADDFIATQALKNLEQDVARDMGMTNEQLQQKIADERTMAALKQADRRAFVQSQANQLQQEADDARAMAALRRLDEEAFNLSQLQGFVPSDVRRYDTMEDLLLGRKRLEDAATAARAREAMGQSVSDSFPLRSPTLEDRLRLLQALGL